MTFRFLLPALCGALILGGCPPAPLEKPPAPASPAAARVATTYDRIDGWAEGDPRSGFEVFLKSCQAVGRREQWQAACEAAKWVNPGDRVEVLRFFHTRFVPYRLQKPDGDVAGLITGYYVPNLDGRRTPSGEYVWPIYRVPDDLLVIDLRALYPALGDYRLRGRVQGRKVVPYFSRGEIDSKKQPLKGKELVWVDDPVELFFLHIQGSGRIQLPDGDGVMVHYADQNGHPYRSIGKLLLERGEMTRDQMSMQNIRAWARKNPGRVRSLLDENPSYIFFEELEGSVENPPGALGIPLTPRFSLAVDPKYIPLGAPVFLATDWPGEERSLRQLMGAQDTGGAIKGEVRADFYWGLGDEAGSYAGRMKQEGRLWLLLPRDDLALTPKEKP